MAVGIICEYNPFHNGHLYHIKKVKKLYPSDNIILVMSGNFTQRGDISIIEKFDKAFLALEYGVDLVVELPFSFATQSADIFAKGALQILNHLKCDKLIFGSESNDVNKLIELATIQLNDNNYELEVKKELEKGLNYPTAMSNALKALSFNTVNSPNDLLGLSYIKEIIKNNYNIEPITIRRTNDYHDINTNDEISSATSIRKAILEKKEIDFFIPPKVIDFINLNDLSDNSFNLLKYKIISDGVSISKYCTVDEGIENRILNNIINCNSLDELVLKTKSKRYTYSKLKRMFLHILCSFKKEENNLNVSYIRVLGFNENGKSILNNVKKEISIPIITNISKDNIDLLKQDLKCDTIYNLITNRNENLYNKKPIIKP